MTAFGHLADDRALPCVLRFVGHEDPGLRPDRNVDIFVLEAAAELHEPDVLPLLKALEASGWQPDEPEARLLQDAVEQYESSRA